MKRILIGIDCDDVLNNLVKGILAEHQKQTGRIIKEEDVLSWDFNELDIDKESVFPKIDPENLEPKLDNINALKELFDLENTYLEVKTYIVSQCPIEKALPRINFIKKYLPDFDNKRFISIADKSLIKLDYLVDDALHNIEACNKYGVKTFLLDMPYNRNIKVERRIYRLSEFVETLKLEL